MEVEGVDTCMLKEYLEKNYGYNEIQLDGLNDNALRQYFKRMLKSGDLARFDTGIYYLPKASRLLKKSYLDPMKVIIRKYIQSTTEIYGYFAGATFANQIGLTTQMPAMLEIIKRIDKGAYSHRRLPGYPAETARHDYNIGKRCTAPAFGCRFPGRKVF